MYLTVLIINEALYGLTDCDNNISCEGQEEILKNLEEFMICACMSSRPVKFKSLILK